MERKAKRWQRRLLRRGFSCTVLVQAHSTNDEAKALLLRGAPHGAAVLAFSQTGGRGRLNREFSSTQGGLYLSFIYKKPMPTQIAALTFTAALACAEAIESLCSVKVGLKWVNDLYIAGKKVGGILTEGIICPETGEILGAIVGIGINVKNELPASLFESATTLAQKTKRPPYLFELCEAVLSRLSEAFEGEVEVPADAYAKRMLFVGNEVSVFDGKEPFYATILGIDERGGLCVRTRSGEKRTLIAGEVTLHQDKS